MLASHLTSQEQLTLLMAPEARKSDVSQDEPSTKKGLRDVERTTATVGLCLWGGIVKGFKVVFASDGFLNRTTRLLISHYIYILYIISSAQWSQQQHDTFFNMLAFLCREFTRQGIRNGVVRCLTSSPASMMRTVCN